MPGLCWLEDCGEVADQRCSGCKTAYYCNREHQEAHWRAHKKECKINRLLAEYEKNRPPSPKPRDTHCTGCNAEFDDEDYLMDQECPDCGYTNCEDCAVHHSRGSCYCQDSNFGSPYCDREPRHYHVGKKGMYQGDYHPAEDGGYDLTYSQMPEAFHPEKRACNRCGEMNYILKKEYRTATF